MWKCILCGGVTNDAIVQIGPQRLQGQFHRPDDAPPPYHRTEIVSCCCCGLMQQKFLPEYDQFKHYFYRSGVSGTMTSHLRHIAGELSEMLLATGVRPADLRLLDIGGNDGTLLSYFPSSNSRLVVDPSDVPNKYDSIARIVRPFPEALPYRSQQFDAIMTIACFYDFFDPIAAAKAIADRLAPNGLWCVEVADLITLGCRSAYDYWCSEHVALYSGSQMRMVADLAGLKVVRVEQSESNGGSARYYMTHRECKLYDNPAWRAMADALATGGASFSRNLDFLRGYEQKILDSRSRVVQWADQMLGQGKVIHILGASTKVGVVLQCCGLGYHPAVTAASDRDPRKIGLVIPGTKIPIVSESDSRAMRPDAYLVGPWHFRDEIVARERDSGFRGDLVFALPVFDVVSL